jgi:hypothetical protein
MDLSISKNNVSQEALASIDRYKAAYNQSAKTIRLGEDLKGRIGITVSSAVALLSLLLSLLLSRFSGNLSFMTVIQGFIGAFFIFALFYILGTIISNGGHVHEINIDTAINTSPFLTNELKSQALQLATAQEPSAEQKGKKSLPYPQAVAEITALRPDMELCIKEASRYREVNPARFEVLQKSNQAKSDEWLIAKLTKVKGTFRSAYGLMVLEAYRRKIDLSGITPVMPPDELPET